MEIPGGVHPGSHPTLDFSLGNLRAKIGRVKWERLNHQLSVLTAHEQRVRIGKYPDVPVCRWVILSQILPDCK